MTVFAPIRTLSDLDGLSEADIIDGYNSATRGDPEPGENRGRAFWHGWRNRMIDIGVLEGDDASSQLASAWLARERTKRSRTTSQDQGE